MAKVLVTGASGFIGSHLAEALLARGDDVTCLVRKTSTVDHLPPEGIRFAYGDVSDRDSLPAAVADNEIVYHVAGCTKAIRKQELYRVNEEGVRNVAEACARPTTPPVLLSVSSLAAAGPAAKREPLVETDPPRPVSHYGRSKLAGEKAAEQYAGRLPITVVRPPIVLGERDTQGLEMFRMIARYHLHLVAGYRRHRFSVIHVRDLVDLLIRAAERGRRLCPDEPDDDRLGEGTYFAACEEDPTYGDLGRMISTAPNATV